VTVRIGWSDQTAGRVRPAFIDKDDTNFIPRVLHRVLTH